MINLVQTNCAFDASLGLSDGRNWNFFKKIPKITQRFINKNFIKKLQLFSVSTLVDIVRIPPSLFGSTLKKAAESIMKSKYESMINQELGYIIMVMDAKVEPMGKMIPGDGGTFHRVEFQALTFYPKLQEIVNGELVDITDFGAFVRIGPTDALLHLSQVMDDYLKSCLLYTSPSPRD